MPVSCASSWRGQHSEKGQMQMPRVCSSSRGVQERSGPHAQLPMVGPYQHCDYRSPQGLLSGMCNRELNASYKHSHLGAWEERTE